MNDKINHQHLLCEALETLLFEALDNFHNSDLANDEKGLCLAEQVEEIYHDVVNYRLGWHSRLYHTSENRND